VSSSPEAPSLTGATFKFEWVGKSVGDRVDVIQRTMPDSKPGSLDVQTVSDIVAFILESNGYPAGPNELGADVKELEKIVIDKAPGT
jgi:hypothetical protein